MTQKLLNHLDEDILRFDYEWREGDRVKAKEIAIAYINKHRDTLEPIFSKYTQEMLVKEIDKMREVGWISDRIVVDMWLLSEYPPQHIIGTAAVKLPEPDALVRALRQRG